MDIRTIDLNLLVVFDALFEERSVTHAANRLALTQPTVSGMLKRLRFMFSDQLFIRTSRGIIPTPRAEELAGPIKELLNQAELLVKPGQFDPNSVESTIKLCGTDFMQYAVLSPLLQQIRRNASGIRVSILPRPTSGVPEPLLRGEIDLYVSSRELAVKDFPWKALFRDHYVCVARKRHPLKQGKISMRQLCSYDHLVVAPTDGRLYGPVDDILADTKYRRRVIAAVPTFQILLEICLSDDYLAFVPELLLNKFKNQLKVLKTEIVIPQFEIGANWHPRFNEDSQHIWLRQQLDKVASMISVAD